MSVFSSYFFKTLRWPLAHARGPLAVLVEGLARSLDEVRDDIIWLRNQFNPRTCDATRIPDHATSRGLSRLVSESDSAIAERCLHAYAWHRLGGGQLGMPRILAVIGYSGATMHNVRADDPERWAEFMPSVPVTDSGLTASDYATISEVAGETKPARSKLAGVRATSSVDGSLYAGGITYTTLRVRLIPERITSISVPASLYGGGYVHTVARTQV